MEHIWLGILALIGFSVSLYIFVKKQRKEKLVCFIGHCNIVINSKYSKLFKIDNTIFGLLYFALIFVVAVVMGINTTLLIGMPLLLIKIISGLAAIFSLVLVYIQSVILKELCEYCLATIILSLIIFLILVF